MHTVILRDPDTDGYRICIPRSVGDELQWVYLRLQEAPFEISEYSAILTNANVWLMSRSGNWVEIESADELVDIIDIRGRGQCIASNPDDAFMKVEVVGKHLSIFAVEPSGEKTHLCTNQELLHHLMQKFLDGEISLPEPEELDDSVSLDQSSLSGV